MPMANATTTTTAPTAAAAATTATCPTNDTELFQTKQGALMYGDASQTLVCPVATTEDHWAIASGLGLTQIKVTQLPETITSMDLSRNQLHGLPKLDSSWLVYINLDQNPIESLKDVHIPSTLTTLSLKNTNISDTEEVELPANLEKIWLQQSKLLAIPKIKSTGLKALYLGGNPIQTISASIELPDTLEALDLSGTDISEFKGVKLPSNLSKLLLAGTNITSISDLNAPKLEFLDLRGMNADSLKLASFSFPNHGFMIDLSANDQLDFAGAVFPPQSQLWFDYCNLHSIDGIPFPKLMRTISLKGNNFASFPQFPKNQTNITEIQFNANPLKELTKVAMPPRLLSLDLSMNNITDIYGVKFPETLAFLNLSGNPLKSIEIPQSLFEKWQGFGKDFHLDMPDIKASCNSEAKPRVLNGATFCILEDATWNKRYPMTFEWDSVETKSNDGLSTGAIVGIVLAALALLGVVVGFLLWRRKKRTDGAMKTTDGTSYFGMTDEKGNPISTMSSEYETMKRALADPAVFAAKIPLELIKYGSLIGRGAHGEVYRGTYRDEEVAIKKLRPEHSKSIKHIESLLSEVKLLSAMEHPNIVGFVGVAWQALTDICVCVELMNGGDLRSLLKKYDEYGHARGLDLNKLEIAKGIAMGLTYLHTLDPIVLHRDLKSTNVLLTEHMEAKLSDFGISREISSHTMTANVGSSLWMAPEVTMGGRYDEKADMFAFGIILSELDSNQPPYATQVVDANGHRVPEAVVLQRVVEGSLRVTWSSGIDPDVMSLANRCLNLNPDDRPSAPEVAYALQLALRRTNS